MEIQIIIALEIRTGVWISMPVTRTIRPLKHEIVVFLVEAIANRILILDF